MNAYLDSLVIRLERGCKYSIKKGKRFDKYYLKENAMGCVERNLTRERAEGEEKPVA